MVADEEDRDRGVQLGSSGKFREDNGERGLGEGCGDSGPEYRCLPGRGRGGESRARLWELADREPEPDDLPCGAVVGG